MSQHRIELARNIGTVLLASNLGEIDPHEASSIIASLVEVEATRLVVEDLKAERRAMDRPRFRLARKCAEVARVG